MNCNEIVVLILKLDVEITTLEFLLWLEAWNNSSDGMTWISASTSALYCLVI